MSDQYIFKVKNHHVESCGKPPQFDDPDLYISYFENYYREQAIFVFDHTTRKATLYMGDANWDQPREVINGEVPDLVMNKAERLWLKACWEAIERQIQ